MVETKLDCNDCDLELDLSPDGLHVHCLHTDGFQYLWRGCRANQGVKGGVYMFECRVTGTPAVLVPDAQPAMRNICRVGVSAPLTGPKLGEKPHKHSYGYEGTGKLSNLSQLKAYGPAYGLNDVIGCIVDMDKLTISYTLNGGDLGQAFSFTAAGGGDGGDGGDDDASVLQEQGLFSHMDKLTISSSVLQEQGLFPHVYLKNVDVQLNFSSKTCWYAPPSPNIRFFDDALPEHIVGNPVCHPRSLGEATVITLVGMPRSGKTFWAEGFMRNNLVDNFALCGNNSIIERMAAFNPAGMNPHERWQELLSLACQVFRQTLQRVADGRGGVIRNIILDQTNVFEEARRKKLQLLQGYGTRKCVVVVPNEEEWKKRWHKRKVGSEGADNEGGIPMAAVMQMAANFVLPTVHEGFQAPAGGQAIMYTELKEADAAEEVARLNEAGRLWNLP